MKQRRTNERYDKRNNDRKNTNRREYNVPKKGINTKSKETSITASVICKEMDEDGKGVVFYQGQRYTVPTLLKGEEAEVELSQSRFSKEGKILKLTKSSPIRIKSKCLVFEKCGGCQYQHVSYKDQLSLKEKYIRDQFAAIKGKYTIAPICGSEIEEYYRCKNQVVYGLDQKDKVISGFYAENTHKIIDFDECRIQSQVANSIMLTIKKMLPKYRIIPFNEDSKEGFLRHVLIRIGAYSKQVLVVFVVSREIWPGRKNFVTELREKHPEITTIVQNINNSSTSMVLGTKERILVGKGYIEDQLCGMTFQISSASFYQVNPPMAQKLYNKVIELASLTGKERVLDVYCGTGTIGLIASVKAKEVIGIELNSDAYSDAIRNAKRNERENIEFYNADATEFMLEMAQADERADVVIMDPPRSGATEAFVKAVGVLRPKRVVYVSCNVETQVRDIKWFMREGYRVIEVQGFDLFPSTRHVESVCLLEKYK